MLCPTPSVIGLNFMYYRHFLAHLVQRSHVSYSPSLGVRRRPSYLVIGVSGHVTLSCNQWRNTAFHLYVVFMQFLKVYSYVKKIFFVIHNLKSFISCCILIFWKFPCLDFDRQLFEVNNCLTVLIFVFHGKRTTF